MGFLEEQGGILKILYVGTRNTIEALESAAFTKVNHDPAIPQLAANTTTALVKKLGLLAGSVVAVKGSGVIGAAGAAGVNDNVVGLMVNDAAGNAYESSSAAASGKGVYVCNMGVYEASIYETANVAGVSIMGSYVVGAKLYSSANGLLTTAAGLAGGSAPAGSTVIGIVMKVPSATDLALRFNMRI